MIGAEVRGRLRSPAGPAWRRGRGCPRRGLTSRPPRPARWDSRRSTARLSPFRSSLFAVFRGSPASATEPASSARWWPATLSVPVCFPALPAATTAAASQPRSRIGMRSASCSRSAPSWPSRVRGIPGGPFRFGRPRPRQAPSFCLESFHALTRCDARARRRVRCAAAARAGEAGDARGRGRHRGRFGAVDRRCESRTDLTSFRSTCRRTRADGRHVALLLVAAMAVAAIAAPAVVAAVGLIRKPLRRGLGWALVLLAAAGAGTAIAAGPPHGHPDGVGASERTRQLPQLRSRRACAGELRCRTARGVSRIGALAAVDGSDRGAEVGADRRHGSRRLPVLVGRASPDPAVGAERALAVSRDAR